DGVLDADAGHGAAVAGRAGRLAAAAGAALGQQVEPVVAGAGRGVHLLARGAGRVAVAVAGQRRVVHVADRAAAHQVDLLADLVVRRVHRAVDVPLGGRAEGVGDELLGAPPGDAARGVVVDAVSQLVADDVGRGDPLAGRVVADLHLGAVVVGVLVVQ